MTDGSCSSLKELAQLWESLILSSVMVTEAALLLLEICNHMIPTRNGIARSEAIRHNKST